MKPIVSRPGGAWALLLAAVVMSAASTEARAYEEVAPDLADFRFVPADAAGFVTARPAALAQKLGLKDGRGLPQLAAWEKQLGLSLADVERLTLVFVAPPEEPVSVFRTAKPVDRERVLKAMGAEAKAVKHFGTELYVNGDGPVVCFAAGRVVLVGPEKSVKQVVEKRGPESGSRLARALRQAAEHDAFLWSGACEAKDQQPTRAVTSCKYRCAPAKVAASSPQVLNLCDGCPLPEGVEAAEIALDVNDQLAVQVRLHFADEEAARRGAKFVRVGTEALRGMMLMGIAELSAVEVGLDPADVSDGQEAAQIAALAPDVLPVLRSAEKALQRVHVKAEGTDVPLAVTVPVSTKRMRTALTAALKMGALDGLEAARGSYAPTPNAPTPFLSSPPQRAVTPTGVCYSAPTCAQPGPATAIPPPPTLVPAGFVPPAVPVMPQAVPVTNTAELLPPPQASDRAAPVAPLKLTVANVTSDVALLFTEGENGKLVFSRKVRAGQAEDVTTVAGQRWVAIFGDDNPVAERHVAAPNRTTWLLRPAPSPVASQPYSVPLSVTMPVAR